MQRKGGWLIKEGSTAEQLVANLHEQGMGIGRITGHVNVHRAEEGEVHVGQSCVYAVAQRLKPLKTIIQPRKQVGGPAWEKASYNWAAQKAVRLELDFPEGSEPWDTSKPPPKEFDIEQIGAVSRHQIVFWDECHKKQCFEGVRKHTSSATTQVRYKRDKAGKLDPNGEYKEAWTELHVKYMDESRYSFGAAAVQIQVETEEGIVLVEQGRRAEPFVYSGRWIHTPKVFEEKVQGEIARVRSLTGECKPWYVTNRSPGVLYAVQCLLT